jgi:hypothetical protein
LQFAVDGRLILPCTYSGLMHVCFEILLVVLIAKLSE